MLPAPGGINEGAPASSLELDLHRVRMRKGMMIRENWCRKPERKNSQGKDPRTFEENRQGRDPTLKRNGLGKDPRTCEGNSQGKDPRTLDPRTLEAPVIRRRVQKKREGKKWKKGRRGKRDKK